MKLKDHVYDKDRKIATIWLEDTDPVQLENLLMILREPPLESQDEQDYDTIIFGGN